MKNPMVISADAVKIRDIIGRIRQIKTDVATGYFHLGQLLKEVRDNQLYHLHGHDTFDSFCQDPDIDINYPLAFRFIRLYEFFILECRRTPEALSGIEYTKLEMLLFLDRDDKPSAEKTIDHWLGVAKDLRRVDLRKAVKEEMGLEIRETITLLKCPSCGAENHYVKFEKRTIQV